MTTRELPAECFWFELKLKGTDVVWINVAKTHSQIYRKFRNQRIRQGSTWVSRSDVTIRKVGKERPR